jgi:hypothetical protein
MLGRNADYHKAEAKGHLEDAGFAMADFRKKAKGDCAEQLHYLDVAKLHLAQASAHVHSIFGVGDEGIADRERLQKKIIGMRKKVSSMTGTFMTQCFRRPF